jgi:hypothetical protein
LGASCGASNAHATVSSSIFAAAPLIKLSLPPKYPRIRSASFSASAPSGLPASAACSVWGVSAGVSCATTTPHRHHAATTSPDSFMVIPLS